MRIKKNHENLMGKEPPQRCLKVHQGGRGDFGRGTVEDTFQFSSSRVETTGAKK